MVPLICTVHLSPCGAVQILQIVFAQELPERGDTLVQQLFGLAVAGVGLASFALVIALVEQASNLQWCLLESCCQGSCELSSLAWWSRQANGICSSPAVNAAVRLLLSALGRR